MLRGLTAALAAALAGLGAAAAQAQAQAPPPVERPTIYLMDQLVTGPLPQELMKQMEPLHSLDAIEALLKANKVAFVWRELEIASDHIDAQVARQITTLPPREPFIAPQGQDWIISVVLSSRPAPQAAPPPGVPDLPPAARPRAPRSRERPAV